nr:transcription factor MYB34-like isoform X1 [Ipomoea batatas]
MGNISYCRRCSIRPRDSNPSIPAGDRPCLEGNCIWRFQEPLTSTMARGEIHEEGNQSGRVHHPQFDTCRDQPSFRSDARRRLPSRCAEYGCISFLLSGLSTFCLIIYAAAGILIQDRRRTNHHLCRENPYHKPSKNQTFLFTGCSIGVDSTSREQSCSLEPRFLKLSI